VAEERPTPTQGSVTWVRTGEKPLNLTIGQNNNRIRLSDANGLQVTGGPGTLPVMQISCNEVSALPTIPFPENAPCTPETLPSLSLFFRVLFPCTWFFLVLFLVGLAAPLRAQERPYFVTYDHYLEEPGSLEVAFNPLFGTQRAGHAFFGEWTEFEYGVTGWWTSEFYLDSQATFHDGAVFTGFRWENRFRPLKREHWINPVVYAEFEDINGADKTLLEIVGHDVEADHAVANSEARRDRAREMELKLILSSGWKSWNFSENFIAEKNLSNEPWEFGYAWGISRPIGLKASASRCNFCKENFVAGIEMYGGLGDRYSFGLHDTSHYLAPVLAWNLPANWTLRVSPVFGLNGNSHRFLLRFGISREFAGFGRAVSRWIGGR